MFETSIEIYYKTMQNQIEYKEGYTPNTLQDPEESFVFGKGWSYGPNFCKQSKGQAYRLGWLHAFMDLAQIS